jgi:glutathione S-transferase
MPSLGLENEPIPLWWTSDFINSSPPGTAAKDEKWIVGEFNCSCVGISKCLPAYCKEDTPNACYTDIPKKDLSEAKRMGNLMGKKGLAILGKSAKGPKFVLGYWNIRGLAAPARMMLEYAGADYKEEMYDAVKTADGFNKDGWFKEAKPKLLKKNSLINLPYVISGDRIVTQSSAVYSFLGQKLRMNGAGPDAVTANNEVIAEAFDLRNACVSVMYGSKDAFKEAAKKFLEGKVNSTYTKFEEYLKQRGTTFFAGNRPCGGDFSLWEMMDQQEALAPTLGLPSPVEGFPGLKSFYAKIKALPQLKKYFESSAYKLPINNKMASFV